MLMEKESSIAGFVHSLTCNRFAILSDFFFFCFKFQWKWKWMDGWIGLLSISIYPYIISFFFKCSTASIRGRFVQLERTVS